MRDRSERKGLYRARDGAIFGICKGVAHHFDLQVKWVRLGAIFLFFFLGGWPVVGIYILAAFIMKPEPVVPFQGLDDQEFYNSYVSDKSIALHRLKDTYDRLDRRIRRMEDIVTAKDYDWNSRLNG